MQQTETYKLNKPEPSDPLSPVPISENADKIEAALLAERAALDQRVTVLEAHHFACGSYSASSIGQTIELGFTPRAVYIARLTSQPNSDCHLLVTGDTTVNSFLRIVEGGFWHNCNNGYSAYTGTYHYVAFG